MRAKLDVRNAEQPRASTLRQRKHMTTKISPGGHWSNNLRKKHTYTHTYIYIYIHTHTHTYTSIELGYI